MRKKTILYGGFLLLLLAALAIPALAETQVNVYDQNQALTQSVVFVVGQKEYYVNGQTPGTKMDAAPFIQDGRTFVPIRFLGYALGVQEKDVHWDDNAQKATLTLGKNTLELTVGSKTMRKNGQAQAMDVAPIINTTEWRTYLPARWVAEGLGYQVEWQPPDIVLAYPLGASKPDISQVVNYVHNKQGQPDNSWAGKPVKPFEGTNITSKDDLGYKPYLVGNDITKIQKSVITKDQLPARVGMFTIYGMKVSGDFLVVTEGGDDGSPGADLVILQKDGNYRLRQIEDYQKVSTNVYTVYYNINEIGDQSIEVGLPKLSVKDVAYWVLDATSFTVGMGDDFSNAQALFIANPWQN